MYRGLGASNGRWVSFLQSVESAYSYRIQQPYRSDKKNDLSPRSKIRLRSGSVYYAGSGNNEVWRKLYLGFICGWLKFGAGTFISIMLGVEPVFAKNWRHFASFGVALMCIQLTPKDVFFQHLSAKNTSGLLFRFCMFTASAIYKLKKMTFVVHTTRIIGYGCFMAIFLCIIECEGSGILRRTENRLMNTRWSYDQFFGIFFGVMNDLIKRTNFWLSILVACTLTLGAHLGDEIAGPHVYTIPWTLNFAAMCILLIRYCRTTVVQLWLDSKFVSKNSVDPEYSIFTTLTSTPQRQKKNNNTNSRHSNKKGNSRNSKGSEKNSVTNLRRRKI